MFTVKMEHKFGAKTSLSGLFIYNHTQEPAASPLPDSVSFLDQSANWLIRHPKVFVVNNTNVLSDTTVLSLRYGFSIFPDGRNCRGGSPGQGCFSDGLASLGFSPAFVNAVDASAKNLFPRITFQNFMTFGQDLNTAPITWKSPITINAAMSKLVGVHTWKFGGDFRRMQVATALLNMTAGTYSFQNQFTAGPGGVGGYDFASFLLGTPSTGSIDYNRGEGVYYLYYGGAYVQDSTGASAHGSRSITACASSTRADCASRTITSPSVSIRTPPVPSCRRWMPPSGRTATPARHSKAASSSPA